MVRTTSYKLRFAYDRHPRRTLFSNHCSVSLDIGLLLIPAAFALAWVGRLIKGNKPAFLTNPRASFRRPCLDDEKDF